MAADPVPSGRPYLGPAASAVAISEALLPEDRARFAAARESARRAGNLEAERVAVERWRGIAILQADPERFAATARRLAERKTGRAVAPDEPMSLTRRAAGL